MTADDEHMQGPNRVVARKDDDETQESWIPLANIKDGQRESWMADRAKHALGTAKLASIYLEQEKGRIRRLRKIKSVLASGKLTGSPTYAKENQGRRRRRPHPDEVHHCSHTENRRQVHLSAVSERIPDGRLPTLSKYPGNDVSGGMNKESWLGEAGPEDAFKRSKKRSTSPYLSQVHLRRDEYLPGGKSSPKPSSKHLLSAVTDENEPCRRPPGVPGADGQRYGVKSNFLHDSRQPSANMPLAGAGVVILQGQGSTFVSGPSAIDLFDNGDVLEASACGTKISTESTISAGASDRMVPNDAPTARDIEDDASVRTMPPAIRRPLVPAANPGMRGRNRIVRESRPFGTAGKKWQRRRPRRATESMKARSPLAGSISAPGGRASRSPIPRDRNRSRVEGGNVDSRRDDEETASKDTRAIRRENRQTAKPRGVTPAMGNGWQGKSGKVRRRWNVNHAARASGEGEMRGRGYQDQLIASARFSSAQARLGKGKDLHELKSEHVEALSILQDISAPLPETMERSVGSQRTKETRSRAEHGQLRERGEHGSSRHPPAPAAKLIRSAGNGPDEASIAALTSDLPRIGSPEEAALRTMYRKWWMDIVNGASPPPLATTPDTLRQPEEGVPHVDVEERVKRLTEDDSCREVLAVPVSPSDSRREDTPSTADGTLIGQARDGGKPEVHKGDSVRDDARSSTGKTSSLTESPGRPDEGIRRKATDCVSREGADLGGARRGGVEIETEGRDTNDMVSTGGNGVAAQGDTVADGSATMSTTASDEGTIAAPASKGSSDVEDVSSDGSGRERNSARSLASGETTGMVPADTDDADAAASSSRCGASDGDSQHDGGTGVEDERDDNVDLASEPAQVSNDVEPVPDEDGMALGEEEGHHGRIYLPDGRFVSTNNLSSEHGPEKEKELGSSRSEADASSGYDDDFEE